MKILPLILQMKLSNISFEIDTLRNFMVDVNKLSENEKERLNTMVNKMAEGDKENAQDIYEHYSDQYFVYESKYVELANNGSLVNSYSFFEYQLKDILKSIKSLVSKPKGSWSKQSNLSYAENLRNEIFAITGRDFTALTPIWTQIDTYRKVRNVIVHNGANLMEEDGKVLTAQKNYALINSFPEIKINDSTADFYIIDRALVMEFLDLVEDYLIKLLGILKTLDPNDIT